MKLFPGYRKISLIAVFIFAHIFISPFMLMMNGFPAIVFNLKKTFPFSSLVKMDNDNCCFPEKLNAKSYSFNLYLCIFGKTGYFYTAACRKFLLKIFAINLINPGKIIHISEKYSGFYYIFHAN